MKIAQLPLSVGALALGGALLLASVTATEAARMAKNFHAGAENGLATPRAPSGPLRRLSAHDIVSPDIRDSTRQISPQAMQAGDQPKGQFSDGLIFYNDFPVCRGKIDYDSVNNAWICTFKDPSNGQLTSIWYPIDKTKREYAIERMLTGKYPEQGYIGFTAMIQRGVLYVVPEASAMDVAAVNAMFKDYAKTTRIQNRKFKKDVALILGEVEFLDDTKNTWEQGIRTWNKINAPNTRQTTESGQGTPRQPTPAKETPAPAASPVETTPRAAAHPAPAMNAEKEEFPASLTEELHQKFLAEDEDYALADALLNLTWKRLKGKLDKNRYKEILQSQRAWVASERDTGARGNAQTLPPAKAYAAEILRRANVLAQQISRPPATGDYQSPEASLSLQNTGGKIQVTGDAGNSKGNTCTFEGEGSYVPGWIRMRHEDFPDFMLLSTGNELMIHYVSSGSAQGCGMDVDFKGSYSRNK